MSLTALVPQIFPVGGNCTEKSLTRKKIIILGKGFILSLVTEEEVFEISMQARLRLLLTKVGRLIPVKSDVFYPTVFYGDKPLPTLVNSSLKLWMI